jgi:hypothetical protein
LKSVPEMEQSEIWYYRGMQVRPWVCTVFVALLGASSVAWTDEVRQAPSQHPLGIWKAAVPPKAMKGEFDNNDPLGVEAGARIWADCSLNWIDPDDGRLYCFVSGTSLEFFLDRPQFHIQQARAGWHKLTAP